VAVAESFAAVAAKFEAIRNDLDGAGLRKITNAVALDAKNDVREHIVEDLGLDRKFSGWKPRLDARYDVINDHQAVIEPRPAGVFKVLDAGRRARSGGLPKRAKRKVYRTPWGLRTATRNKRWRIGATRGKGTWTKAVHTIADKAPERVDKHTVAVLSRHLGRG
jgi:hypothetical protein